MHYTPKQTRAFLQAIADEEADQRKAAVITARIAQLEDKSFKQAFNRL